MMNNDVGRVVFSVFAAVASVAGVVLACGRAAIDVDNAAREIKALNEKNKKWYNR